MIGRKEIEIEIEPPDGPKVMKKFVLSKFPAVAGREIVVQYMSSGVPKLGDYAVNEAMMFKILAFVGVPMENGEPLMLNTRELIDNHIPNWEALVTIEKDMLVYNIGPLRDGKISNFLDDLLAKLPALISSMLTPLLEQSSPKNTPHSTN